MVQPAEPFALRKKATDLLDVPGSLLSLARACDDTNPCLQQFVFAGSNPSFDCVAGVCNDPLAPPPDGVVIGIPETGDPGEAGGTQIRFVFDKLLNSSFETVTIDPTKLPGSDKKYKLAAGIAELDGPDGMPVALGASYWDATGSPTNTSDPIRSPFGPAIVLKPAGPLAASAMYTAKLTSSMITDRKNNPLADQNGMLISGTYTKTFMTEALAVQGATSSIDVTAKDPPVITPDEVIQLGFNTGVDEATVVCTVTTGGTPVMVEAYGDRGAKPTKADCAKAQDDLIIDIASVSKPGTPADWAEGDYAIECKGTDDSFGTNMFDVKGTFKVKGPKVAMDPLAQSKHLLPEQCL